jgi:AcrR family transcriptional regulator
MRADAVRNRDRLLQAARVLFAERGLNVSMDEIARCAGVGVGTAYRRFASRMELIDALIDERVGEVEQNIATALAAPDPWPAFAGFVEAQVALQVADRGLRELFHEEVGLQDRIAPVRARLLPMVEEIIHRAKAAGELRPDFSATDLEVVVHMLVEAAELAPGGWRRYLALLLRGLDPGGA